MKKLFISAVLMGTAFFAQAQQDSLTYHSTVVVTGTREPAFLKSVPATLTVIDQHQLMANHQTSLLPSLVENTPGLFATSRGVIGYGVSTNSAGSIKVRGVGSGAQLLVLIDGQPQYAGLMGHPIPDAYMGLNTQKVEILRGPSSVLYGSNAMGGVVNIITSQPYPYQDYYKGDYSLSVGSYGTVQAQVANTVHKGNLSAVVNMNYQRTDGHRDNSNFDQLGGYLKLGYHIAHGWDASADLNLTNFGFMNPGPDTAPLYEAEADITRGLASVSVKNQSIFTEGTIRAFYDWGHHDINDGHTADKPSQTKLYKHDDFIAGVNAFQTFKFFEGNRTTFGLDYQTFGGEAWNENISDGAKTFIGDYDNPYEVAGYLDIHQKLAKILNLNFGFRVNYHSVSGTELVPQGGIALNLPADNDIKLVVSKGFRNPVIREMYMFPPHNPDLEPERMMNYELGYHKNFSKGSVGLNLFIIDGENLIVTAPNPSGAGKLNQNLGEFKNSGFELEGSYRPVGNLRIYGNYSYLHMDTPVEGAPESKLNIGVSYNHEKFFIGANIENISGLYLTTGNDPEKENYTLVNLTADYKINRHFTVFLRGENLLAQKYQTYAGFWMPKATFMGGIKVHVFKGGEHYTLKATEE